MRGRLKKKKECAAGGHYLLTKSGKFYSIKVWIGKGKINHKNLLKWARWFETSNRIIGHEQITPEIKVSTVFLGLDYSFRFRPGPPILFETMIFGGEHHHYQARYTTRKKALKGHREAVAMARRGEDGEG